MLAGLALLAAAGLFAAWSSLAGAPRADAREQVVAALGGGVYLTALAVAAVGLSLVARTGRPSRARLRQLIGAAALALAGWGVIGSISPETSLGGVSLAEHSLGGAAGAAFANPWGALTIGLLLPAGAMLIAPQRCWSLATRIGQGFRRAGRAIRQHGPAMFAAAGCSLWTGLTWYFRLLRRALSEIRADRESARRRKAQAAKPSVGAAAQWTLDIQPPDRATTLAPEPPLLPMTQQQSEAPTHDESPQPEAPTSAENRPTSKRTLSRQAADGWRLPPLELLEADTAAESSTGAEVSAKIIVDTLASFGVDARIAEINRGPSVTQFGIEPGWEVKTRQVQLKGPDGKPMLDADGHPRTRLEEVARTRVRVNRITRLANDLALALAAPSIRVEAPVPGRPVIGIEVPNEETRVVTLRGLLESDEFRQAAARSGLPIALGRDVRGRPVVADLTKMPHVLIAGATGSGKSVCINTIITCLLLHHSPRELRLVMVDPKRVELTGYADVPHLALSEVITEVDQVVRVLAIVVGEMERRYRRLEQSGTRNIASYNALPGVDRPMPYWVVVLDELADLMMAAPVEVEQQLVRLAQLARATGIHLVVATQRPSVDVVTGLIKANFPTRVAFATTSQTDARVIMDRAGAEKLLGRGDMLLMSSDSIKPRRVQGAYVSDDEIDQVIEAWTAPAQPTSERSSIGEMLDQLETDDGVAPETREAIVADKQRDSLQAVLSTAMEADWGEPDIVAEDAPSDLRPEPPRAPETTSIRAPNAAPAPAADTRFDEAAALAREHTRISSSLLQRRLRVGQPRAERLIEQLEAAGIIAPSEGGTSRRVLDRTAPESVLD